MNKSLDTFAARLAYSLALSGLNERQLAQALRVKQQTVSNWKLGKNLSKRAYDAAHVLGVSPDWLIHGRGEILPANDEFLRLMEKIDDAEIKTKLKDYALFLLEKTR